MTNIDLSQTIDLRDLQEIATDADDIIAGYLAGVEEVEESEYDDAKADLAYLSALVAEMGYGNVDNGDEISDALDSTQGQMGPVMIRDDYFTDYAIELVEEVGDMPSEIPSYIENNINWEGVAEDLKVDYTTVTLADTDYYIR